VILELTKDGLINSFRHGPNYDIASMCSMTAFQEQGAALGFLRMQAPPKAPAAEKPVVTGTPEESPA
jgi:hypothetical protein